MREIQYTLSWWKRECFTLSSTSKQFLAPVFLSTLHNFRLIGTEEIATYANSSVDFKFFLVSIWKVQAICAEIITKRDQFDHMLLLVTLRFWENWIICSCSRSFRFFFTSLSPETGVKQASHGAGWDAYQPGWESKSPKYCTWPGGWAGTDRADHLPTLPRGRVGASRDHQSKSPSRVGGGGEWPTVWARGWVGRGVRWVTFFPSSCKQNLKTLPSLILRTWSVKIVKYLNFHTLNANLCFRCSL